MVIGKSYSTAVSWEFVVSMNILDFAQPYRQFCLEQCNKPLSDQELQSNKGKENQTFMKTYIILTEHLLMENHAL